MVNNNKMAEKMAKKMAELLKRSILIVILRNSGKYLR